jgi:hypothetical protein
LITYLDPWHHGPAFNLLHLGLPSPRAESERRAPQFTSIDFIKALKDADIQISMDGKAAS